MSNDIYYYVSLNDSETDPIYASAGDCDLVITSFTNSQIENPCSLDLEAKRVPVLPQSIEDIKTFASIMGWSVEYGNEGQMLLNTNKYSLLY